jgi:hypothetical protein
LFAEFETVIRRYGGESQILGTISSSTAISAWLSSEFHWFSSLTEQERLRVVNATGGLPEIVVGWREANLEGYDVDRLRKLAAEISNGIYRDVERGL